MPAYGVRPAPAQPERRSWLKRLGALVLGAAVAAPAAAGPRNTLNAPYIGEIMLFAGSFAPRDYLPCDGQLLPISEYDTLFSLIGTTYGGDGQTTFALPDLRGRAPRHFGQGPSFASYSLGQSFGAETVTLTQAQAPAHTHGLQASTTPTSATPVGFLPSATVATDVNGEAVSALGYADTPNDTAAAGTVQSTGSGQAIDIMPPSLAMTYCISVFGVYPSFS